MPLRIDYRAEGFPSGMPLLTGSYTLATSWDELIWAAITVGRPNRHYVFRHGKASIYEALFRLSLIRMALEQRGSTGTRLWRSAAARTLDPSEKGAVSYFLGLTFCKLFSAKLLDAPWMLHLDVFGPMLDTVLTKRSRPDLIGQTQSRKWLVLECKGRVSPPDKKAITRAKQQATRVVSISGVAPTFHIGGFTFFKNEVVRFHWIDPDPEPEVENPIRLNPTSEIWARYYMPALELIQSRPTYFTQMREQQLLMPVDEADIEIGIDPVVLRSLAEGRWEEAREVAEARSTPEFRYHDDGIAVRAGPSWFERLEDSGSEI
jgi:hypothetical protein